MRQGSRVLYTNNLSCAEQEIKNLGARITHQFSECVIVVNFPTSIDQELNNSFITPTRLQRELSEIEKRLIQAWKSNEEESRGLYHAPLTINSCDALGFAPSCNENGSENLTPSGKGITPADTSRCMIGKIAIGLVIVSGTSPDCKIISKIEEDKVLREVIKGTDFLANEEPRARITFRYYLYFPKITINPNVIGVSNEKHEKLESPWRDAALEKLGCSSGDKGINELINKMKGNSDWAYVAFFTKYTVSHFAYARHRHLVMNYDNGPWGPDNINRIFAHETCHIFGAMDEYEHDCDPSGILQIINGNAQNCPQIKAGIRCKKDCLMNSFPTLVLCEFSRGQLGWPWDLSSDLKKQVRISLRNGLSNSKCTIRDKRIAAWVSLVIGDYGQLVDIYEIILKDPDCTPEDRRKAAEIKESRWLLEIRKVLQKIFKLLMFVVTLRVYNK